MTTQEEQRALRTILVASGVVIVLFVAMVIWVGNIIKIDREALLERCIEERGVADCYIDMVTND